MNEEIDPSAVPDRLAAGSCLLDVREPAEWAEAHVRGALFIPLGELESRIADVPADREVICMCRSGRRSAKAQAILKDKGRTRVLNMAGGILRWAERKLPVEAGP